MFWLLVWLACGLALIATPADAVVKCACGVRAVAADADAE